MNILVAGGAGYIGSVLVPALLDRGYGVTVIDAFWFGDHLPNTCTKITKNLFDCEEEDFKGIDQVIYLGGLSNDPMAEFDPVRNFIYNAALPSYLAYHAKRAEVKRYIYASTCSVYGYSKNELYDEESEIRCNYPYGVGKLQGEKGCMHLDEPTQTHGDFRVICLRKGTVSGYSPRMRFDLIVNTMFKSAILEKTIRVSNPAIWRPILSVKDSVTAYLRAVQADSRIGGVFNIAYDNYTVGSVADIVKDVAEKFSGGKVKIVMGDSKDIRNYKVKIDKAQTVLGFHPSQSVEKIATELANHWHQFEKDIADDKYYNIKICENIFKERLRLV
jgi:nucleoside-diphosphate-sugar epimerase